MEFVTSILGCIGPCMLDSIKSRDGYVKRYDDNIVKLDGLVQTLEARETDVLKGKKAAERNCEEIMENVQKWIQNVDRVKKEARKFMEDNANSNKRCFRGWFPNVRTHYRLSREAESKHEAIEGLCKEQEKFDVKFALPAPPPGIDSITSKDFVPFQTTKLAMEKVMDALIEDSIDFVGIHGMGGVGKTTLVKQIAGKCKEERLFDNVVIAVVSQTVNIESIQEHIAELLGRKLEGKSVIARASQLCNRLKQESKILVILDDLWAELDLAKIGIPSGEDHKGCKVVITTRRKQVCTAMGGSVQTTRIVPLEVLTKEESWNLFKSQVIDNIESLTMRSVAEKVCKKCGGLPIALVTVGKAMRGKDPGEWEEAALELEKAMPVYIEGMDENVFKCIKLSYNHLRGEEVKACFLLCCLFPEDYDIETETLVRYGVGLNIFKRIEKIQEARRRAFRIIDNLKASSLLIASKRSGCFKMHDVVRDVAQEIASGRYFVKASAGLKEWPNELTRDGYNGVGGINLMGNQIDKYPDALECPDLEILLMQNDRVEREVPEEVFKGMKKLRVLDQSFNKPGNRRLEPSFSHLTSLQTLIIDGYSRYIGITLQNASIWGIGALGELKMLQVVSLRYWTFEEPLDALRKMRNLRLLDLAFSENCSSLFNLAEDCNFPQLEELCLTEAVPHSVVEVKKCCPRLNVLWFHMDDISHVPHNFDLPHYFNISMGGLETNIRVATRRDDRITFYRGRPYVADYFKNTLNLDGVNGGLDDVALPNKIGTLMARVSVMTLSHLNGLRNIVPYLVVDKDSLAVLKELKVEFCDELECLITIEERRNILRRMPQLESLSVRCCKALEYLFDLREELEDAIEEEGKVILTNFKKLTLRFLWNLKELWKGNIGLVHLRNLKTAEINNCPKLKFAFHWSVAQRLEQLQELSVEYCNELEDIVGRQTGEETVHNGPTGFVPFRNLKTVKIEHCPKLKVVFHWSVAQRLEQLQDLAVWDCDELEAIVGSQTGKEVVHDEVLFPELRDLSLLGLPKLNDFYTGNLPGSQRTPKLKTVCMGKSWRTEVEIAVDGMNLDRVIKDHKELLVPDIMEEEEENELPVQVEMEEEMRGEVEEEETE